MSENKPTHADKMTIFLVLAKEHLDGLQDCLRLARQELKEDQELQEKVDIERALGEIATCSTWVRQSLGNSAVTTVVRAYRGVEW